MNAVMDFFVWLHAYVADRVAELLNLVAALAAHWWFWIALVALAGGAVRWISRGHVRPVSGNQSASAE